MVPTCSHKPRVTPGKHTLSHGINGTFAGRYIMLSRRDDAFEFWDLVLCRRLLRWAWILRRTASDPWAVCFNVPSRSMCCSDSTWLRKQKKTKSWIPRMPFFTQIFEKEMGRNLEIFCFRAENLGEIGRDFAQCIKINLCLLVCCQIMKPTTF